MLFIASLISTWACNAMTTHVPTDRETSSTGLGQTVKLIHIKNKQTTSGKLLHQEQPPQPYLWSCFHRASAPSKRGSMEKHCHFVRKADAVSTESALCITANVPNRPAVLGVAPSPMEIREIDESEVLNMER